MAMAAGDVVGTLAAAALAAADLEEGVAADVEALGAAAVEALAAAGRGASLRRGENES
jgi:hypothetical protein